MKLKIKKFCFPLGISLAVLAAIAAAAGLLFFFRKDQQPPTLRIGVAMYSQEDTFIHSLVQNFEQIAHQREAEEGLRINLNIVDAQSSQLIQNEQIEQLIALDYDVLCVNIVDRTAAALLIDRAREADVPIVFFNRQPVSQDLLRWEKAYYVGAPAEQSGILQGQIALELWEKERERLDRNGDHVLQYVILEGEPGHQDALIRTEKCVQVLTEAGVRLEKLASDTANWNRGQASAKMIQWWDEYGEEIEAVFANNDDMALGVLDVLPELGVAEPYPIIVGVDATEEALEAVRQGKMSGTVLNDGAGIAQILLELSLALYHDRMPSEDIPVEEEHYVWLPYRAMTPKELLTETDVKPAG